ncbi:NCS2 family permease [Leptolyngbya sp. AN03gr2]|uniref:NCS2 family permease n=1 Tax=unclassified Leptolyngbya TaxID=2650499 RepID=UPI003D31F304
MLKQRTVPFKPTLLSLPEQISQYFQFEQLGTNYRTEWLASLTTFMAIAPTLVVNAHILGNAVFLKQPGDLFEQIVVALALCSAVASFLVGVLANYPFAVSAGTGTAALFAFSIVLGMGMNWRLAFTAAFVQGILFTVLSVSPFRRTLNDAIPNSLKQAMVVSLGLFLSYIALSGKVASPHLGAGIIAAGTTTPTILGNLEQPATLIAIFGILLTILLMIRRVKGALSLGIVGTALLGWSCGVAPFPQSIFTLPHFPQELMGQAIAGVQYLSWSQLGNFIAVVFILLFVSLSDSISSLNVLGHQMNQLNAEGELRRSQPALLANGLGTAFGALIGSTPTMPYVLSVAGIIEGGRSGFVAIVVAALFLISTVFAPLFAAVPAFATTPMLVIIGVMMMSGVRSIDWTDLSEAIPAFLVILIMPLTFSIADGVAAGLIAHAVAKVAQRDVQKLRPFAGNSKRSSLILAGISVAYFTLITLQT